MHAPTEQFPMGALAPAAPGKSAPVQLLGRSAGKDDRDVVSETRSRAQDFPRMRHRTHQFYLPSHGVTF